MCNYNCNVTEAQSNAKMWPCVSACSLRVLLPRHVRAASEALPPAKLVPGRAPAHATTFFSSEALYLGPTAWGACQFGPRQSRRARARGATVSCLTSSMSVQGTPLYGNRHSTPGPVGRVGPVRVHAGAGEITCSFESIFLSSNGAHYLIYILIIFIIFNYIYYIYICIYIFNYIIYIIILYTILLYK